MVILAGAFLVGSVRLTEKQVRALDLVVEDRALNTLYVGELTAIVCKDYGKCPLKEILPKNLFDVIEHQDDVERSMIFQIKSELHLKPREMER